jgi:hypothetical protein
MGSAYTIRSFARTAKIANARLLMKFLCLLVLRRVERVGRHVYIRFPLIMMGIQTVTAPQQKGHYTKYLQIKKKDRGVYPTIGKIF